MKCKIVFFEKRIKWYNLHKTIFAWLIRNSARLNNQNLKDGFAATHTALLLNGYIYHAVLSGVKKQKWDEKKFNKTNKLRFVDYELKSDVIHFLDARLGTRYSVSGALAAFNFQKILGEVVGSFLNKVFDKLSDDQGTYCSKFITAILLKYSYKRADIKTRIINYTEQEFKHHPILHDTSDLNMIHNLTPALLCKMFLHV